MEDALECPECGQRQSPVAGAIPERCSECGAQLNKPAWTPDELSAACAWLNEAIQKDRSASFRSRLRFRAVSFLVIGTIVLLPFEGQTDLSLALTRCAAALVWITSGLAPLRWPSPRYWLVDSIIFGLVASAYFLLLTVVDGVFPMRSFQWEWIVMGLFLVYALMQFKSYRQFAAMPGSKTATLIASGSLLAFVGLAVLIWFSVNDAYARQVNRGIALLQQKEFAEAEREFTRALERNPMRARAWYHRGRARKHLGDFGGAVADFTAALERNPKMGEAYFERARTYLLTGEIDQAGRDIRECAKYRPELKQLWDEEVEKLPDERLKKMLRGATNGDEKN